MVHARETQVPIGQLGEASDQFTGVDLAAGVAVEQGLQFGSVYLASPIGLV